MAIQIQFRRGTASEWTSANPILALAEMGIETDTDLFKIGNGVQQWNSLDYGGVQGYTGSQGVKGYTGSSAAQISDNVLYVAKNGSDTYAGTSLSYAKLTIKAALDIATRGTTIFVKSGNYTEINPMTVPDFVSIVGDGLRAVTVSPYTPTSDLKDMKVHLQLWHLIQMVQQELFLQARMCKIVHHLLVPVQECELMEIMHWD